MDAAWKSQGKKLHTRNIEIATYECDENRIIVEGFMKDD